MSPFKPFLVSLFALTAMIIPSFGAVSPRLKSECLAPARFLTALTMAGDWILKRNPQDAPDAKITGVVFRERGMIDVAVFREGCLAAVVVIGKAPPDLVV